MSEPIAPSPRPRSWLRPLANRASPDTRSAALTLGLVVLSAASACGGQREPQAKGPTTATAVTPAVDGGNAVARNSSGPPTPPSCAADGPGLSDCGVSKESCCTSPIVTGGTYFRMYKNDGSGPTEKANPATVSNFRLDKYEVTVGRFRQFVNAWNGGWKPLGGSGKHTHLNGGRGLVN